MAKPTNISCKHGNWTRTAADTSYVLLSFTHTFQQIRNNPNTRKN